MILNFWTKLTQKGFFQYKKEKKNENDRLILYIRNSLRSKLQLQQTILIFWNTFSKKRLQPVENMKKMNITIEFFKFKLV